MSDFRISPNTLPRRSQRFALRLLELFGWQVEYEPLPGPRGVIVFFPHTSNWDVVVGLVAKWAIGVPIRWLAKESLFSGLSKIFIGRLLLRAGAQPIERHASTGAIERLGQTILQADWYWLALSPEGTRKYRPHWRSGFYYIARAAQVPVAFAYIDYPRRMVGLVGHLDLTGDIALDMQRIRQVYEGREGLHPECAAHISLEPRS